MCLAHFKHLRCGCLQVKCEQLLDEFLVIEGSDESVLDVPFLFLSFPVSIQTKKSVPNPGSRASSPH